MLLIDKQEDLLHALQFIKNNNLIFLDTETAISKETGNWDIVLIQIGNEKEQFVIDCDKVNIKQLKPFIESTTKLKVGHNLKYDAKVLKLNFDWTLNNIYDTMLVEQLIYCGLSTKKGFFSLEETSYRYSNINPYSNQLSLFDPYIPKSIRMKASKDPAFLYYAATDIISTYRAYKGQQSIIEERKMHKLVKLECAYSLVLADMELTGMPINKVRWKYLDSWVQRKMDDKLALLNEAFPVIEN